MHIFTISLDTILIPCPFSPYYICVIFLRFIFSFSCSSFSFDESRLRSIILLWNCLCLFQPVLSFVISPNHPRIFYHVSNSTFSWPGLFHSVWNASLSSVMGSLCLWAPPLLFSSSLMWMRKKSWIVFTLKFQHIINSWH